MKKINVLRILSVLMLAVMALTAATPALAEGPVYMVEVIDFSSTFPSPCGFDILGHTTGILKTRIWFSDNGTGPKQFVTAPNLKATWSANGKSLNIQLGGPQHSYMIEPGVQYLSIALGTWNFATVPGTGQVLGWAGQIQTLVDMTTWEFEDIKIVGNPPIEAWGPICAYLAP